MFSCPRGRAFAEEFFPGVGLLTASKKLPGGLPGGGGVMLALGID